MGAGWKGDKSGSIVCRHVPYKWARGVGNGGWVRGGGWGWGGSKPD